MDQVRAKNINPSGHTRLPRYVRGRVGKVVSQPDAFLYADARAHGGALGPQHVYTVRFESAELWGPDNAANDALHIDLYETYVDLE